MKLFSWFKKNKKITTHSIDLDEVFMDSLNVSGMDHQQFEGVIERSITKKTSYAMEIVCVLVFVVFAGQLIRLQVASGADYFARSENNRLHSIPIFSERGVIYDRNQTEIAWNIVDPEKPFSVREYINQGGFAHLIGYVGYPTKDKAGFFWRNEIVGKVGIEKRADAVLTGVNGKQLVEVDARQEIISQNMTQEPVPGKNVTLTIDAGIQGVMYDAIKELAETRGFEGGAGIMMDIHTGEILALTSYPEYDLNILSHGSDVATISGYATDPRQVYLNRAISGRYTPGSTVKPFLALGALNEGVITTQTKIFSNGYVEIPNPYNPENAQRFRDWRPEGHGTTDVYHAIADSVNTFFYAIGGGLRNQSGLGISRIDNYMNLFAFGTKTGIDIDGENSGTIPNPEWKKRIFPSDPTWRLGDTYNSSIGQFGFQVTLLEMTRAISAIANKGKLVQPFVLLDPRTETTEPEIIKGIDARWYDVVHQGMRQTVTAGTAQSINVDYVFVAAKTGTAQVGARNAFMNSWSTGFFPYENPNYAFVIMMDKAKSTNQTGATFVMRRVFDWMQANTPEYFE
jgi:penicillin-binding protein 2